MGVKLFKAYRQCYVVAENASTAERIFVDVESSAVKTSVVMDERMFAQFYNTFKMLREKQGYTDEQIFDFLSTLATCNALEFNYEVFDLLAVEHQARKEVGQVKNEDIFELIGNARNE